MIEVRNHSNLYLNFSLDKCVRVVGDTEAKEFLMFLKFHVNTSSFFFYIASFSLVFTFGLPKIMSMTPISACKVEVQAPPLEDMPSLILKSANGKGRYQ